MTNNIFSIPNLISLARLVSILPITYLYLTKQPAHLFVLLTIVFISDLVDGQVARHFKMETKVGKVLDMLSDNIIINLLLVLFCCFPINGHKFSGAFVIASLIRSSITVSKSVKAYFSTDKSEYRTGLFGQVNAFALMYFIAMYILSATTPQFAAYFQISKYALYFFITLRVAHVLLLFSRIKK